MAHISLYSANEVHFSDLSKSEAESLQSMSRGASWCRIVGRRVESVPAIEQPPDPIEDPFWSEIWQQKQAPGAPTYDQVSYGPVQAHHRPSLIVQHLCADRFSVEGYKRAAARMQSYGFFCLRSKRNPEGQYWELWFLPGLYAAKGALAEAVGSMQGEDGVRAAMNFLMKNTFGFGTLDVCVQRLGMCID